VAERGFTSLVSEDDLSLLVILTSLGVAMFWGAAHALSPGHGKTMVTAYLVGQRGTPRHAALLGLIVTVTHTLGVFALGLVTLLLSQFIVPDDLYPWLNLVAGLLVVAIGAWVLLDRARARMRSRRAHRRPGEAAAGAHAGRDHGPALGHGHERVRPAVASRPQRKARVTVALGHDHGHGHESHPAHDHDHAAPRPRRRARVAAWLGHDHDHGHSHDHDHLPTAPGVRGLVAVGVSGGLLPCPSALVVLLAAISLHRVGFGLALVLAFSVGLALTITGIGLIAVLAKRAFSRVSFDGRLVSYLPAASALVIFLAGVAMTVRALPDLRV
jgi:nickel/cobalt transporter (NicO) family protein